MQRRLLGAGYAAEDVSVAGPTPTCQNLVATLRGRDRVAKPILLMAHLDVVSAKRSDWAFDPYVLREADGWFYGRGALDNKAGASVLVVNMAQWKRDGFVPARDVVMALTCDEEGTAEQGIQWLIANVPRLKSADYALNTDAGDVRTTESGRVVFGAQAAEKVYATFTLTATNPGGHSSVPRGDNAIYTLATALQRLATFQFPVEYNDVSRTTFARAADLETGQRADDMRAAGRGDTSGPAIDRLSAVPHLGAQMRTTCVATMLAAGHAENALAQSATATVNCRILPGSDIAAVQATLTRLTADSRAQHDRRLRADSKPALTPSSRRHADGRASERGVLARERRRARNVDRRDRRRVPPQRGRARLRRRRHPDGPRGQPHTRPG